MGWSRWLTCFCSVGPHLVISGRTYRKRITEGHIKGKQTWICGSNCMSETALHPLNTKTSINKDNLIVCVSVVL